MRKRWVLLIAIGGLLWLGRFSAHAAPDDPPGFVWWEAETPAFSNFPDTTWFSADEDPGWDYLSGGQWLTSTGPATGSLPPTASYVLDIPEVGEYQLWVRKFWRHGPMHYRFGDRDFKTLGRDIVLIDRQRLPKDAEVAWVYLDTVDLPAGPTTFEFQLAVQPGEDTVSGIDCFVLTQEPFFPRGKLKPGERPVVDPAEVDDGWFVFDPPRDTFREDASLDLRHLNEDVAGMHGPLRRSPDGNSIHLGDGTPVRFWGVNLSAQEAGQPDHLVRHTTRRLAKLGVNMIRHHSPLWIDNGLTYGTATGPVALDPVKVERLHHLVAAAKQQGIYTNLSWYFPLWINDAGRLGLAGYDNRPPNQRKPFAVLFFNEKVQKHYFDSLRELMTAPNPHTGLTLAEDPAVGLIEICNEDNLFFWTFDEKNIPPPQWAILDRKFADHLTEKYGSLANARKRWPRAKHERDAFEDNRVGVFGAWHMTREGIEDKSADERKRIAEQVAFLAGLQRGFYEKAVAVLRDELNFRGLISASNWYAADPALLDAVERWTYTATDVIDQHGYFNPKHEGEAASYSVRVGQTFDSRAAVLLPNRPPLRTNQVEGHPQMISEMGWTTPNRYRADATLLTAAAMSVQGIDAVNWFIWNATGDFDTTANKFALATPTVAGMFPAMALMARRGDLPEANPVVHEALQTEALFNLKGTAAVTEAALDDWRAADVPPGNQIQGDLKTFDPLSAYVGRVSRSFDESDDHDAQINLAEAINRERKQLVGLDTQGNVGFASGFRWDWGEGVAAIDTPRTQGVTGFLDRDEPLVLSDFAIKTDVPFGQVVVTSLDGLPLRTSRRLLIQAVTEERFTGWKTSSHGQIMNLGRLPWQVRQINASVSFYPETLPIKRIVALDAHGHATDDPVEVKQEGRYLTVTLPPDRLYTLIER